MFISLCRAKFQISAIQFKHSNHILNYFSFHLSLFPFVLSHTLRGYGKTYHEQYEIKHFTQKLNVLFTWCFVYTLVNCLPSDSLISGKLFDDTQHELSEKSLSTVIQSVKSNANPNTSNAFASLSTLDNSSPEAINANIPQESLAVHKRAKRLFLFRPLFVYRHQQLKKRRIEAKRQQERRVHEERKADRYATYSHQLPPCSPCAYCDCH